MHLKHYRSKFLDNKLSLVISFGFFLRLIYLIWGADIFLGSQKYIMGDTYGWTESFKNLINFGTYSFDLKNPEAAFGRVPGFSFFWGIHYLIFGNYAFKAIAITQMLLDTIAIFLIYKIAFNIYNKRNAALIAAFLYAVYPFIIAWITVSYSELLSNFLCLLILSLITKYQKQVIHYVLIGILCAFVFLVREFLGLLLPIALASIIFVEKNKFITQLKYASILTISFLSIYSLWPLRNYLNHNKVVLARTVGGFPMYNTDYQSFRSWVNTWDPDETKWLNLVIASNDKVEFPSHIFNSSEEKAKANKLIGLARSCGSSFQFWKNGESSFKEFKDNNCNSEISIGFNELRSSLIKRKPFFYLTHVPLLNLKKSLFKSDLKKESVVESNTAKVMTLVFFYRSALVLLGLIDILLSIKNKRTYPVTAFSLFLYFLFCVIIRFIEMRNLLQADTVLLIPASYAIFKLGNYLKLKSCIRVNQSCKVDRSFK